MSTISDTATVTLLVNGTQAKKVIDDLKNNVDQAKKKLQQLEDQKATPKDIEKARKEVRKLERQLEDARSATENVKDALENLDKVTPRQLEKTLRSLNKQFKYVEQGSEAYYRLAENIRVVKEQLESVRSELDGSQSIWERFCDWAFNTLPALQVISEGYDALIGRMREYVDAYSSMDQEMANVRKFTGMTSDEVEALNSEFKNLDTRTSREDLNKLAQEAGRLGKSSVDEVMEFVRAADKINVALDDLGSGATLTLSKLTGIFGVEEQYGTEQSLLKVGSVINELSQNCSASAPYITNFTERVAGVGVQAKMTIPQIMGFAAVLDSNSQALEASATAVSQVLVRLYQDPAKYARVAGLDVKEFSDLLKKDANEAMILFLETLNKAGGMDVLSPMFKDMGETGSRAIDALTTLADKIKDVKSQQEAANIAFLEGTSINNEFAVQNNTVEASIEKCKKSAHELQVELGERLYPLMSHFMSSSSAVMRALLTSIRYIAEHKTTIITLTVAISAYIAVMQLQALWLDRIAIKQFLVDKLTKICTMSTKAFSGVISAGRLVVAGLANSFEYLKNGLQVTYFMQERWKASMAAMNFAGWSTLIIGVATAAFLLCKRFAQLNEQQKILDDIRRKAVSSAEEEIVRTQTLVEAAKDENRQLDERQRLVAKLNSIIPDYNAQIDETTGKYKESAAALEEFNRQLVRQYEIEGAREKLKEIGKEKAEARMELSKTSKAYESAKQYAENGGGHVYSSSSGMVGNTSADNVRSLRDLMQTQQSNLDAIEKREKLILEEYGVEIKEQIVKEILENDKGKYDNQGSIGSDSGYQPLDKASVNSSDSRFKAEDDWRLEQETKARIAYAKGEDLHSEYTDHMNEIAEEYYSRILERDDLSNDERLKYQADYWDSVNKMIVSGNKHLIDDENKLYEAGLFNLKANLKARLESGTLSAEEREQVEKVYQESIESAELAHLSRLVNLYAEGSDDRMKAKQKYQEAEIAAAKRHQQEMESLEAEYARIKKEHFGNNPEEDKTLYDKHAAALDVVYQRELTAAGNNAEERLRIEKAFLEARAALRKMYNQESETDTRNSMQKAVESSVEWLGSDGGKALAGTVSILSSGMSSIFSGLSTMIQSELQVQTAAIETRYDKEIKAAEGNSYRVAKLEKEKAAEIAKVKNEANRKMFAMQVIQAVAQTATNALNAYGSAAAIPVVGHILAPIAAAMAVAAGTIQVAAIKKQQQASETQGYSKGGFTRPGAVDEPAGIVHAGEWVASQRLLASPVARPMIEALDYAQRTNTIGSLRSEDVSRSITAPQSISRIADGSPSAAVMAAAMETNAGVIGRLVRRLDEPFVTVATVAGDHGINRKQEEYTKLLNNKSPKSRRKSYANNN